VAELILPSVSLHAAFLESLHEWGPGAHEDGFGRDLSDDVESPAGFAVWVAALNADAGCLYRWIIEDDRIVGAIALRLESNDLVMRLGHIGYGIRPSARRRGLGSWAVSETLQPARQLGLERVLLVCESRNIASATMIESLGGVAEETERYAERRYWISLGHLSS